jgi:hypothetical protein
MSCTTCGAPIRYEVHEGYVESDYVDKRGRCFTCADPVAPDR